MRQNNTPARTRADLFLNKPLTSSSKRGDIVLLICKTTDRHYLISKYLYVNIVDNSSRIATIAIYRPPLFLSYSSSSRFSHTFMITPIPIVTVNIMHTYQNIAITSKTLYEFRLVIDQFYFRQKKKRKYQRSKFFSLH